MSDPLFINRQGKVRSNDAADPEYLKDLFSNTTDITSTIVNSGKNETIKQELTTKPGVVAGAKTAATVTVDSKGRITSATSNTSIPPSGPANGDLTGFYPDPTLDVLVPDPTGTYTAANITVDAKGRVTAASDTLSIAPNGAAGGDLSGTYPSPLVSAITSDGQKLTIGTISDGEFLKRSGNTLISGAASTGLVRVAPDGNDLAVFLFSEAAGVTSFANTGSEAGTFDVDSGNAYAGAVGAPFGTSLFQTSAARVKTAGSKFQPTSAITVSCWVSVDAYYNGIWGKVIWKSAKGWPAFSSPWVAADMGFVGSALGAGSEKRPYAVLATTGVNNSCYAPATSVSMVFPRDWIHMGFTYDGANVKLYIDGRLVASAANTGTIAYDANGPWVIGCPPTVSDQNFGGRIHDLRIADIARPLNWFQDVYQKGTGNLY